MAATRELLDENETLASVALSRAKQENERIERNIRAVLEVEKNEAIERQSLLPARRKLLRTALVSPRDTPVVSARRSSTAERPHTPKSFEPHLQGHAGGDAPGMPVRMGNKYPLRKQSTLQTPATQQQSPAVAALPAPPVKSALKKTSVSQQQQPQQPPEEVKTLDEDVTSEISADSLVSIRTSRPPKNKMAGWEPTFDGRFRRRHDFRIRMPNAYTRLREDKPEQSPSVSSAADYADTEFQAAPATPPPPPPPPGTRTQQPYQTAASVYSTQRR